MTIKNLPAAERPYERVLSAGPCVLTDRELLAVLLRTGTLGESSLDLAARVLSLLEAGPFHGLGGLAGLSVKELTALDGIGPVKAVTLLCAGELGSRMSREKARESLSLSEPSSIAAYLREHLRFETAEVVLLLCLDASLRPLGSTHLLARGTVHAASISAREIYLKALELSAVYIVLAHNHPGGQARPSRADQELTGAVFQSGEMLGIPLLDHLIITQNSYFSFKEQGLLNVSQ